MPNFIETLAGQFYWVRDTDKAELDHVWLGVEVKRVRGGFADKAKAREILVRKLGTRAVSAS